MLQRIDATLVTPTRKKKDELQLSYYIYWAPLVIPEWIFYVNKSAQCATVFPISVLKIVFHIPHIIKYYMENSLTFWFFRLLLVRLPGEIRRAAAALSSPGQCVSYAAMAVPCSSAICYPGSCPYACCSCKSHPHPHLILGMHLKYHARTEKSCFWRRLQCIQFLTWRHLLQVSFKETCSCNCIKSINHKKNLNLLPHLTVLNK